MQPFETTLPEDFDGTFKFTNRSKEDFTARWDNREYVFPAESTSPMIILNATPLEVQSIRKKFAREWAVIEFFKSKAGQAFEKQERNGDGTPKFNSIYQAVAYTDTDLKPFIQMCLEPLPQAKAKVQAVIQDPLEDRLSRDDDGQLRTQVVDKKTSLREKALKG